MSLDKVWAEAARKIVETSDTGRPGPEWFNANEFAEQFGWTRDRAKNFLHGKTGQFEKRVAGPRTWWRIYPSKKVKK